MSPTFISGVTKNLTEAEITFDRFHVMKLIVMPKACSATMTPSMTFAAQR